MEISNLTDTEFTVKVIQMFTNLGRRLDDCVNVNKEIENIRTYQTEVTELKNTITELKNTIY